MPISSWMRAVKSTVLRRVEPPAPQVTETNDGESSFSSAIARNSGSKPASVLGGKNSNEMTGRPRPNPSRMRMSLPWHLRQVKGARAGSDSIRRDRFCARSPPGADLANPGSLHGRGCGGHRPPEERLARRHVRALERPAPARVLD